MPKSSRRSRRSVSPVIGRSGLMISPLVSLLAASLAHAGPEGEQVTHGSATFQRQGGVTTITASDKTIIQYHQFNVPAGETVRFVQPNAQSRVLNRVTGGDPSRIDGTLTSNGKVYITNPAGVYFGAGALVNVGSIYAAAGSISDTDFLKGHDRFTDLQGDVVNEGSIRAADEVHFLGRRVANLGSIEAEGGVVTMLAGDEALIGRRGGHIYARVSADRLSEGAQSRGIASGDLYSVAIHDTAKIRAEHVRVHGERVDVRGNIDVANGAPGGVGGTVGITGDMVVVDGARIDASGSAGGGAVAIGGGFQGRDPTLHNSRATLVSSDSVIHADATERGDGGTVVVWSDGRTIFGGDISVRGADQGGDGGLVEVSGKENLLYRGHTDATAENGKTGTLLLDPTDIRIVQDGADAIDLTDVDQFTDPDQDTDSDLVFNEIDRDLIESSTSDVVLQASHNIELGSPGDDVNLVMDNAGVGLTLQAGNSISLYGRISTKGGAVTLSANDPASGAPTGTGHIQVFNLIDTSGDGLSAPINMTLNGGSGEVLLSGSLVTLNAPLTVLGDVRIRTEENPVALRTDAGAGDILIDGAIRADIPFPGLLRVFSGTGDVTIGDGTNAIVGMASTVMSVDGTLRLRGNVSSDILEMGSVRGLVVADAPLVTLTTVGGEPDPGPTPLTLSNALGLEAATGTETIRLISTNGIDLGHVGQSGPLSEPALFSMQSSELSTLHGNITATNINLVPHSGPMRLAGDVVLTDRDAGFDLSAPGTIGGPGALTIESVGDVILRRVGLGSQGTVEALTVHTPGVLHLRDDVRTNGGDIDFSGITEVVVEQSLRLDTDRAGGSDAAGDLLFAPGAMVHADGASVDPVELRVNLQADGGGAGGLLVEPDGFFRGFTSTQLRVGTMVLEHDAPVDGDLLISGRLLVGADSTIDTNPSPLGSGDPRGLGPGGALDLGAASISATGGNFALALDASSTDDAAGDVALGGVFRGTEQYLSGLTIDAGSPVAAGALTSQNISIDGPFKVLAAHTYDIDSSITINTNSDTAGAGSLLDLSQVTIAPGLTELALTLRAQGFGGAAGGDIVLGPISESPIRLGSLDAANTGATGGVIRVTTPGLSTRGTVRLAGDVALDSDLEIVTQGGLLDLDEARFSATTTDVDLSLRVAGSAAGDGRVHMGSAGDLANHFLQSITIDTSPASNGTVTLFGDLLLDGSASAFALVGDNPLSVRGSRRIDTDQGGFAFSGPINLGFSSIRSPSDVTGDLTLVTAAAGANGAGNVFVGGGVGNQGGAGLFLTGLTIDTRQGTPSDPGGTITLRNDVLVDGPITLRGKVNLPDVVTLDSEQGGDSNAGVIDLSEGSIGGAELILDSRAAGSFASGDVRIGDYGALFAMSQDALTLRTRGGATDGNVVLTSPNGRSVVRVGTIDTTDAGGVMRVLVDSEVVSDSGADLDLSVFNEITADAAHTLLLAADGSGDGGSLGELRLPTIGLTGTRLSSLTARGTRIVTTGNVLTAGDQTLEGEVTIDGAGIARTLNAGLGTLLLDPASGGATNAATVGDANTMTLRASQVDWLGPIVTGSFTTTPRLVLRPHADSGRIIVMGDAGGFNLSATELGLIGPGFDVLVGVEPAGANPITVGSFDIQSDLRLSTAGPAMITLAGDVTTHGTELVFDGDTRVGAPSSLATTAGGANGGLVRFNGLVTGEQRLTIDNGTSGDLIFAGTLAPDSGDGIALDIISAHDARFQRVEAASITQLAGTGTTTFNGPVLLHGESGGPAPARGYALYLDTASTVIRETVTSDGFDLAFEGPVLVGPSNGPTSATPRIVASGGDGTGSVFFRDTLNSMPETTADVGVIGGDAGVIDVLGVVGGVDPLGDFSLDAGGVNVLADVTARSFEASTDDGTLRTVVRTINDITLHGPFVLVGDSALRTTRDAGGDLFINGPTDGTFTLTLDSGAAHDIFVNGPVGSDARLGAIDVVNAHDASFRDSVRVGTFTQREGAGHTVFEGGLDTTGAFAFTGNRLTLGLDASDGDPSVIVLGGDASIHNAGLFRVADVPVTLGGGLTQTGEGPVSIGTDLHSPTVLAFESGVTLTRELGLRAPRMVFAGGLDASAFDLTICSADLVFGAPDTTTGTGTLTLRPCDPTDPIFLAFDGATPGADALDLSADDLASLADGFAQINIGWQDVGSHRITVGSALFRDPVTLYAPAAGGRTTVHDLLAGTGDSSITYQGSGDGLTLVGAITTEGRDILIDDALRAGSLDARIATGTGAGGVQITGGVDGPSEGAGGLAIDAGTGVIDLLADAGASTPLAHFDAIGSSIFTRAVTTAGDQTYTGAFTPGGDLASNSGSVIVTGPATLVHDLRVDAGGAGTVARFAGPVEGEFGFEVDNAGGEIELADVTTHGSQRYTGDTTLAGDLTTVDRGSVSIIGATTLADNLAIRTAGGTGDDDDGDVVGADDILLDGTVDGMFALALDAGDAAITVTDAMGAQSPLVSLAASANTLEFNSVSTKGGQTYVGDATLAGAYMTSEGGSILIDGPLTISGESVAFATSGEGAGSLRVTGTTDGASSLAVHLASGGAVFEGDLGGEAALHSLAITAAGAILPNVTTTGAQTYDAPLTLQGDLLAGGAIDAARAILLASDLRIQGEGVGFGSTINSAAEGPFALTLDSGSGDVIARGGIGLTAMLGDFLMERGRSFVAQSGVRATSIDIRTSGRIDGPVATGEDGDFLLDNPGVFEFGQDATFALGGDFVQAGAGRVRLGADIPNDANDIIFSAPIELTADSVMLSGDRIELHSVFNGGEGMSRLTVSAADAELFGDFGAVSSPLRSFDDGTSARLTLDGRIFSHEGIRFDAPVIVAGDSVIRVMGTNALADSLVFADTITSANGSDLVLLVNLETLGRFVPRLEFHRNIGIGGDGESMPLGSLYLNADPLALGGVSGLNGHTRIPEVASIFATDDIRVRAVNDITMGQNEKWSTVGSIDLFSQSGAITLGDLAAVTTIDVTAPRIFILARAASGIRSAQSEGAAGEALVFDDGVDYVAGESITFSAVPVVLGVGPVPTLATTSGGDTSATLSTFPTRAFGPLDDSLVAPGYDLRSSGPTNTNVSSALAGAVPREAQGDRVTQGTSISSAQREALLKLGINARDAGADVLIDAMIGRAFYNDTEADAESASARVTAQRLPTEIVNMVLDWYANDFQKMPGELEEGQTPEDAIRATLDAAIEGWDEAEHPKRFDAVALRQFIGGSPEHADAATYLEGVRTLLTQMEWLGLSEGEQRDARQVLLSFMRPRRLSLSQFTDLVMLEPAGPELSSASPSRPAEGGESAMTPAS